MKPPIQSTARLGLPWMLACAAWAFAGCDGSSEAQTAAAPQEVPHNVRVLKVARTDLEELLTVTGPVRAVRATDVSAEETGVVAEIPHDKGATVHEGDVLVALDRDLLRAEMESAQAELELRRYKEERLRTLAEASSASREELLEASTVLERAKQAADIAKLRFDRAQVKAPYDGVVADRFVEIGQMVTAGTKVARLVDPFVLELEGYVTEREVTWLKPGGRALVALEGHPEEIEAQVHWVSIEAEPSTGKFAVEIRIPNPQLALRTGVVGRAHVLKATHRDVVAIPRDALVEGTSGPRVFVVENDRAQPHDVTLGADQGLMVVITDGLLPGERLVVRGQRELRPGALVVVQEEATARDGSVATDPEVVRESSVDSLQNRGPAADLVEPRR
jgi:membrane fusion protein (multidrug efflux system)